MLHEMGNWLIKNTHKIGDAFDYYIKLGQLKCVLKKCSVQSY